MKRLIVSLEDGSRQEFDCSREPGARSLPDVLASRGIPLNTRCGQRGLCRGCEVILERGEVLMEGQPCSAPATLRSCRARLTGDLAITVPARSRIEHRPQVGETFRINVPIAHQPLFAAEPGVRDLAFAADIGTTTVVVLLVDLVTGEVRSRAGAFNNQIRFGDNVLTRIDAGRDPEVVKRMQVAVVSATLAPLLARACARAGSSPSRIAGGVIAGNTTMLHLLVGEDPTALGVAPFTPRFVEGRRLTCHDIGLATADGCLPASTPLQLLPGVAAYVGADIMAGVYATGMIFDPRPSLLVDIGTNGEVVLQNRGRLTACATAAGPAFEGCGLRSGTRAREGAVSGLRMGLEPFSVVAEIIGGGPVAQATGICGSGYIDFLAQGRRSGLLRETGRFDLEAWKGVPASHRLREEEALALRIADADGQGETRVSEVDVALLLQAKAAIGAGIEILLEQSGLRAAELGRVYLAGGFGMHLNIRHAIEIGLLPGFQAEQVQVVGNTSLAGAVLGLLDRNTVDEMESLRSRVEVLELNLQEGFEDRYVDQLSLP